MKPLSGGGNFGFAMLATLRTVLLLPASSHAQSPPTIVRHTFVGTRGAATTTAVAVAASDLIRNASADTSQIDNVALTDTAAAPEPSTVLVLGPAIAQASVMTTRRRL